MSHELKNPIAAIRASSEVLFDALERDPASGGPGVDPGVAPRVFERFTTTRPGQGGTGLGLAIVRAVAESHGGRAELRPGAGEGSTTFALVIPAA